MRLELLPEMFAPQERRIAGFGNIAASAFRYPTGVAALRITNRRGEIIVLPFQGQQIWDATFDGRRLTMRSVFDMPVETQDYLANYGAFFLHCGAASMGNPGPGDSHPLHGELPNAVYRDAWLSFGADEAGEFVEIGGTTRQARAFSHAYRAEPILRIGANASCIDARITIANERNAPMETMYLAHVNFLPADGAALHDTVRDDRRDVLRRVAPAPGELPSGQAMERLDGPLWRAVPPPGSIATEDLHVMQVASDAKGWAVAAQAHGDGTADFVRWRPEQLPHLVRWVTRRADEDAMGLSLPATAWPDGLAAARQRGQIVLLPPGGRFTADLSFGLASAEETPALLREIASIRAGETA
jgi:hypothetical protein